MAHLLAAVDLSDVTPAVIAEAELLAQALGAKLTLLFVADQHADDLIGFGPTAASVSSHLDEQRAHLEKLAAEIRYRGIHTDAVFITGPTAKTILHEADARDASMIVLGSHGHGLVGGTSAAVIKSSRRPVLVVPDPRPARRDND
jgi:nucleotide-binding universal stress UspA family protein